MIAELKDEPNLLIVGLGLMGVSLAAALKTRGYTGKINGLVRQQSTQQQALASGWFDRVSLDVTHTDVAQIDLCEKVDLGDQIDPGNQVDFGKLVADADIIILATPLSSFSSLLKKIKPHLLAHTLITDVGSVKACVRDEVVRVFGFMPDNVVLGHPIAGSERNGLSAADPNLYQRQTVILTPTPETSPSALQVVKQMWLRTGANVTQLDVDDHDRILAATSHLPHLLAFSLVDTLAGDTLSRDIFAYAAGGFRDFTRIAASDPLMWRDIFRTNRVAIKTVAQQFRDDLDRLLMQLDDDEPDDELLARLTRAKQARDEFSHVLQSRNTKFDSSQVKRKNLE